MICIKGYESRKQFISTIKKVTGDENAWEGLNSYHNFFICKMHRRRLYVCFPSMKINARVLHVSTLLLGYHGHKPAFCLFREGQTRQGGRERKRTTN
jgi:hypothetical protein